MSKTSILKQGLRYVVLLSVLLLLYWMLDWGIEAVIHSRKVVVVPEISGRTVAQAMDLLTPTKLGLIKEGEQYDREAPVGTILRQAPPLT